MTTVKTARWSLSAVVSTKPCMRPVTESRCGIAATARWSDSVHSRLRSALVGRTARGRASMAGSQVPCRVEVLRYPCQSRIATVEMSGCAKSKST